MKTNYLGGTPEDQEELDQLIDLIADKAFPFTSALLRQRHEDIRPALAVTAVALAHLAIEAVQEIADQNDTKIDSEIMWRRMTGVLQQCLDEAAGLGHRHN